MHRLILAAVALLVLTSPAAANPFVEIRQQICTGRSCTTVIGSGTIIGRDQANRLIVLTCQHGWSWPDHRKPVSAPRVTLDGQMYEAAWIGHGPADVGLMCLDPSVQTEHAVRLAAALPPQGTAITTHAILQEQPANHQGIVSGMVKYCGFPALQLSTRFDHGESGGAVLAGGRLIGVINATSDNPAFGIAATVDEVRKCVNGLNVQLSYPDPAQWKPANSAPAVQPAAEPEPSLFADFHARLQRLEKRKPIAGPTGLPGPAGAPGRDGIEGTPGERGQDAPAADLQPVHSRLERVAAVAHTALTVANWLGVGMASGGGIGAVMLGLSLFRRLRQPPVPPAAAPVSPPPQFVSRPPVIVSNDSPPPPQAIIPETHFVAVERDTYAEAYDFAKSQLVRKFPGSEGTIGTLDSLIDQFLSSKGFKKKV